MATYVVGDVQGCFKTFQKLLLEIKFDTRSDKLILLGDVINRGPESLKMLRLVKSQEHCMEMILGNHEIFALGLHLDALKTPRPHTMQDLLMADDRDELMMWLRKQPLIKRVDNCLFVHAGILPAVSIDRAVDEAKKISSILEGNKAAKFLSRYFKKTPSKVKPKMGPKRTLRIALAYLTLIRMCESPTTMNLSYNGNLNDAPSRLKPWFDLRNDSGISIFFGHWAGLGLHQHRNYYCLDSGCVWRNKLSALRISDYKVFQVNYCEQT